MVLSTAKKFRWTSVGVIGDTGTNRGHAVFARESAQKLIANGRQAYLESYNSSNTTDSERIAVLRRLNVRARVYFYFGDLGEFRRLLLMAANLNMTSGEHVYIPFAAFRRSSEPGFYSWDKGDSDDEIVRQAYRSVLLMEFNEAIYGKTNGSENFTQQMIQGSKEWYNYTYQPFELVTPHPAATYSTMMILAQVERHVKKEFCKQLKFLPCY
ncbi:uncharacterized protein LOC129588739 [Paramacrobiotus metropolitanus]|uniref:uncharacterized protein LOC129588739 n=1 Tax=Paramacrobiotus metropolitanus TaxID=2943436 RepID=UPI002445B61E|nr:uncharacterized protein LOC129588739 [Paramacrobiotus metropolitanus]